MIRVRKLQDLKVSEKNSFEQSRNSCYLFNRGDEWITKK